MLALTYTLTGLGITSLCHYFGRRPFSTRDQSRNLAWLAPFAAWDIIRIAPERQRARRGSSLNPPRLETSK